MVGASAGALTPTGYVKGMVGPRRRLVPFTAGCGDGGSVHEAAAGLCKVRAVHCTEHGDDVVLVVRTA